MTSIRENSTWILFGMSGVLSLSIAIVGSNWLMGGIVASPLIIYLCIKNPFIFPFGAYALFLPLEESLAISQVGGVISITRYLGALSILVFFVKGIVEKKIRIKNCTIWFMLFVLYAVLSGFWAMDPSKSFSLITTAIGLLLLYIIVGSYDTKIKDFNFIKYCLISGGVIAGVITIYNFGSMISVGDEVQRVSLSIAEKKTSLNKYAFYLLIPVSACMQMFIESDRTIMRNFLGMLLCLMIISVVVTGSNGGMLAVGCVFMIYFIYARKKMILSITILAVIIASLLLVQNFLIERILHAVETGGSGRLNIWSVALEELKKYWITGIGLNNFPLLYHSQTYIYKAPHNIILGIFLELGVVGISLFVIGIFMHHKEIVRPYAAVNGNHVMLKASFWGVIISSIFLDTLWTKSFWLLWIMILMYGNVMKRGSPQVASE